MLRSEAPSKEPMADAGIQLLEVRAGNSPRTLMELKPGAPVNPTSVGRTGMWNIDAPGILDVHAYLFFDGNALFVQSADPSNPAKGNGKAIATSWQQMEIPCTIEMGKARLVYRTLETLEDDDDKTMARPMGGMPPPPRPGGVPAPPPQFRPGGGQFAPQKDDESTQYQPLPAMPPNPRGLGEPEPTIVAPLGMDDTQQPSPYAKPLPAAGQPAWQNGPQQQQAPTPPQRQYQGYGSVQVAMPQQQLNMQGGMSAPMQQPGMNMGALQQPMQPMGVQQGATQTVTTQQPTSLVDRMKNDWQQMPVPRKILLGLLPLVLILVVVVSEQQSRQQAEADAAARREQIEAASASAMASETPDTPPVPTPSYTPPITTFTTPPTGLTITMPTASAAPIASVVIPVPSAVPSSTAAVKPNTKPTNVKTTERLAVDAVAASDFKTAAGLYDQLAAAVPPQDPRQKTYAEAARIMHHKAAMETSP